MKKTYHDIDEEIFEFQNEYGHVLLRRIGDWVPVKSITRETYHSFITLEQVEQVALITENRTIQTVVLNVDECVVLVHRTTSEAAICQVDELTYTSDKIAQEELDRPVYPMGELIYGTGMDF